MFGGYVEREDYEDELYREMEDSSGSEVDSELEFELYSQVHYSCHSKNEGGAEENELKLTGLPQLEVTKRPPKGVIVIDSDPEIITVSDSSEEEDGVCGSKGSKMQRPPPAGMGRTRTRAAPAPALLRHHSSDSDSDSDSDELESWMVLGQRAHRSDKTIQLNLEGGATINFAEDEDDEDDGQSWMISRKDLEAGICNQARGPRRTLSRYYTSKNVTCRSCRRTGHLSKNCPNPKKRPSCTLCGSQTHLQKACPSRPCSSCSLPGHCYQECRERPPWHRHCQRCGMTGHFHETCTDIWRQYHLTTQKGRIEWPKVEEAPRSPAYCYNCSRKGHFGFECTEQRMFSRTFPTAPYVSYYDGPRDLRKEDTRAQRKAQVLCEAGLLRWSEPEQSRWPEGGEREEGPLRKRMQIKRKAGVKVVKDDAPAAKAKKVKKKREQLKQQKQKKRQKQQQQLENPEQQQLKKQNQKKKKKKTAAQKRKELQRAKEGKRPHHEPWAASFPAQNGRANRLADEEDFQRGPKRTLSWVPTPPEKVKFIPGLFGQGKNRKSRQARKAANRKLENMYPTDENLFVIKQKRKR